LSAGQGGAGPPRATPGDVARTHLANERTYLAWWRAALAALAVALAVGRLTPDLLDSPTRWPYVVLGSGYAVIGVVIAAYGLVRHRAVNRAVITGEYLPASRAAVVGLTVGATILGLVTFAIIVARP
jgi:putative membrane protein